MILDFFDDFLGFPNQFREPEKTLDTIVLKDENTHGDSEVVKLYRESKYKLIGRIKENKKFLSFLQKEKKLKVPTYLSEEIPLIEWNDELRYKVVLKWMEGKEIGKMTERTAFLMGEKMAQLHLAAQDFKEALDVQHIDYKLIDDIFDLIVISVGLTKKQIAQLNVWCDKVKKTMIIVGKESHQYGMIHSDLHLKNWVRNGREIIPIDFDELAYGHYLTDIAVLFIEFEDDEKNAQLWKENFKNGYQTQKKLPKNFDALILDFQQIASLLYLNWYYDEDNYEIRSDQSKTKYADAILQRLTMSI